MTAEIEPGHTKDVTRPAPHPPSDPARGWVAGVPHGLGLVLVIAAAVSLGRPTGWIGVLAAVGPPVGALGVRIAAGLVPPGWRDATAFGIVIAVMTAGMFGLLRLSRWIPVVTVAFPAILLVFLLGAVNFVAVSVSRTIRAARHQPLEYPWIPAPLARAIGASLEKPHNGNS